MDQHLRQGAGGAATEPLLDIRGLKTHFRTEDGMVHAVDGVDVRIHRGETVGIVGESGCGKTVTAMSVLKLIAMPPGEIVAGQILWRGPGPGPPPPPGTRRGRRKENAHPFPGTGCRCRRKACAGSAARKSPSSSRSR